MLPRRDSWEDGAIPRLLVAAEAADGVLNEIPSDYWPIGVAIVLVGSFLAALGDVMVRKAFIRHGDRENSSLKRLLRDPIWLFGMFFTAVLDPLSVLAALVFAPASVVTPFAGVHIFWGVLLAKFWLKESVGIFEGIASGLIILGIVLIITFAGKQKVYGDVADCIRHVASAPSIVYMVVSGALILLTGIFSFDFPVNRLKPGCKMRVQRVCTAGCSGLLGGNTNIAAKAVSVAITGSFADPGLWTSFSTYSLFGITLILALCQLYFLNRGLRMFEAAYIVPATNSFLIASGTIGSIMVLHEYPTDWALFFFALFLVVIGITALSYEKSTVWKIVTCSGGCYTTSACHRCRTAQRVPRGSFSLANKEGLDTPHVGADASQVSPCSCRGNGQAFTPTAPTHVEESAESSSPHAESLRLAPLQGFGTAEIVEASKVALPDAQPRELRVK